jgi:hypothetical protein
LTHAVVEGDLEGALKAIEGATFVVGSRVVLRVETLDDAL